MKNWQLVLEEFAVAKEPQTWELPRVRLSSKEKFEAVQFLLEKNFICPAGRQRDEHMDLLYEATLTGLFVWRAGFCMIQRPNTGRVKTKSTDATLAERTASRSPVSVWDLARVPWTWVKKPGTDRSLDAEA